MPRFALTIAYQGGAYSGWQRQPAVRTIQGTVEAAITKMRGGDTTTIAGASRTDAGVHAEGQVAIFDYPDEGRLTARDFMRGLNALTPDDIAIREVREVADTFHPRFASAGKRYRYCAWIGRPIPPARHGRVWGVRHPGPLDLEALRRAATHLEGEHDFAAFRASDCEARTTTRRIWGITAERDGGGYLEPQGAETDAHIVIEVRGNAFLKNMVRILAGTLIEVGLGKRTETSVAEALAARDRKRAGRTAPACGLSLVRVYFDDTLERWARTHRQVVASS